MNTGKTDGIQILHSGKHVLPIERWEIDNVIDMLSWGYSFSDPYFVGSARTVRDLMLAGF